MDMVREIIARLESGEKAEDLADEYDATEISMALSDLPAA